MLDNITLPIEINLWDVTMNTGLLGSILFLIIYLLVFYISFYKKYEPGLVFDHVFKSILTGLVFSRLLGILNNFEYYLEDGTRVFQINDGIFSYPGILIGIVIASMFFSNKFASKVGYMHLLDLSIKAYVFSVIFLILGFFLNGRIIGVTYEGQIGLTYKDGIKRFPYALIEIIYNLLSVFIISLLLRSKVRHGITTSVYIMIFSVVEFILRFFSNGFDPILLGVIDLHQFLYLVMIVFSIMLLLRINQVQSINIDESSRSMERIRLNAGDIKREKASAKEIFSLSYNTIEGNREPESSVGERLNSWYKTIKRKSKADQTQRT